MCTATWLMQPEGYELFCNRDELRTRAPAEPPAAREQNGVRCLAPCDPEAGGSWIAVNEYGMSLCLLNYYPPVQSKICHPDPASAGEGPRHASGSEFLRFAQDDNDGGTEGGREFTSRGLLLTSLADWRSPDEIARILWQKKLQDYRPFLLVILAPRINPLLLKWDGERIFSDFNPQLPVTTSSFDTARVIERRRAMFVQVQGKAYHFSRDPAGGAYSVCMSRDDAQTVSYSHIVVTPDAIRFDYVAAPFTGAPWQVSLPRHP